ncbi:hypothetical protein BAE44_0022844 [Dichanthelium oligosanthes]|uniref:EGF-like domain-containing protein n=1 Tax=Dichanthelium oligosanthes TaxID=888268 RepID=A0A1E5UTE2_9POAL|nr:hypothetical protein BAE44_0022844 [Dichanthelium oligosanthes]
MKHPSRLLSIRLLLLCLPAVGRVLAAANVPPAHQPGCKSRCGDVDIPYPFGIGDQCAIHSGFRINCTIVDGTYRPFKGPFEVTKISIPDAKAWMKMGISWRCYGQTDTQQMTEDDAWQNFTNTPFSYVVVMEEKGFSYNTTYPYSINFWNAYKGKVPVVMDWIIRFDKCEVAKKDTSSHACVSSNSECVDASANNGRAAYRCTCQVGYEGNPYVKDGCTDIDECLQNSTDPCAIKGGTCQNTQGSFTCLCPQGKQMINDMCTSKQKSSWLMAVVGRRKCWNSGPHSYHNLCCAPTKKEATAHQTEILPTTRRPAAV